jgi:serine/threonine protein phosphatase 1
MATIIKRLPENKQGKDYVVGDLHGCFSLLDVLLAKVHFDKQKDRLFSVGDLIDRGPESLHCLFLLEEPWFMAVCGNHESMCLDFFLPYRVNDTLKVSDCASSNLFFDNGGAWIEQYYQANRQCMTPEFNRGLDLLLDMPLILVVGEGENRFHVIHAELIRSQYNFAKTATWLNSDIDRWFSEQRIPSIVSENLLWSRTLMSGRFSQHPTATLQPGLSTTFCGHSYAPKPQKVLSHICVDTGAFLSSSEDIQESADFGLTLFDVQASRWYLASYQRHEIIQGEF